METKYYIINNNRKAQEVDLTTYEHLYDLLKPEIVNTYLYPSVRKGVYLFTLTRNTKQVFDHPRVTLFDASVQLQNATGLALHHAERILKASPEACLMLLPACS